MDVEIFKILNQKVLKAVDANCNLLMLREDTPTFYYYQKSGANPPKKLDLNQNEESLDYKKVSQLLKEISFPAIHIKQLIKDTAKNYPYFLVKVDDDNFALCCVIRTISSQNNETSLHIEISKVSLEEIQKYIYLSQEFLNTTKAITKNCNGLVLINNKDRFALSLIRAFIKNTPSYSLEQSLANIDERFLVVENPYEDIADGVLSYLELAKSKNILKDALQKLDLAIILKSIRKQCGVCAKPTTIPSSSKDKFPVALKSAIPDTYQFSRGCNHCEYSSFNGYTFIESYLKITKELKDKLEFSLDPASIYQEICRDDISNIYKNTILQIQTGRLSVEEAINTIPTISNAFDNYLSSMSNNKNVETKSSKDKPSILIVEDDENQREVLKLVFNSEGYDVVTANNGKEAINIMSKQTISVILSDLMMPEMNGFELLKHCKQDQALKHIPVLMLTASSNPDHELTLLEQGADDYCPKNIKKKVLLKRVERLLDIRPSQGPGPLDHFLKD